MCVFKFQRGHCENGRNSFLQVRMVGARPSANTGVFIQNMVKLIFSVGLAHFTFKLVSVKQDTPNGRNGRASTLELSWLTKRYVSSLNPVVKSLRCCGLKWTRTLIYEEKTTHTGGMVGFGNFETTDGLRTDSLAADVDSHNCVQFVCSGSCVHSFFRSDKRLFSRTLVSYTCWRDTKTR